MNNKISNWKWNAVVVAAAIAGAAAPASAQGVTMRATVPFAFSINKDAPNLAAGKYVVIHDQDVWRVRNEDTHQNVAIVNFSGHQGQAAEEPSLTFDCLGTHCQLRTIRMGGGALGAEVPTPQLTNSDKAELGLVSVSLKPIKDK